MKGDKGDECNRTVCRKRPAEWYNRSTQKHYCGGCASLINQANAVDARRLYPEDGLLCVKDPP